MNTDDITSAMSGISQSEAKDMMLNLLSSMTPERFSEHMWNMQEQARQSGKEHEREELVCRLLASDMSVEEIAVVLCIRAETIRIIEKNNSVIKIPEYTKKLKERRRRRQR